MSVVPSLSRSHVIPYIAATMQSRSFLELFKENVTKMHLKLRHPCLPTSMHVKHVNSGEDFYRILYWNVKAD